MSFLLNIVRNNWKLENGLWQANLRQFGVDYNLLRGGTLSLVTVQEEGDGPGGFATRGWVKNLDRAFSFTRTKWHRTTVRDRPLFTPISFQGSEPSSFKRSECLIQIIKQSSFCLMSEKQQLLNFQVICPLAPDVQDLIRQTRNCSSFSPGAVCWRVVQVNSHAASALLHTTREIKLRCALVKI